ncbi:zinc finger protein castor homolog 1-like [Dreissena polymorpha]|uniref:zinc finger protein castor homolog 1-like n=1 Tax=Dreissena polymorpha TaxID=45954 RepID=UPI0022653B20|nr:zinc finger protein castor homolog 1-like [Dreissena polymorpha]XP_052286687.1 zinc finger protein castor homolog 1-like [Dreissena polymorpha]
MAHKFKKRLGKLDAICAKLKLNTVPKAAEDTELWTLPVTNVSNNSSVPSNSILNQEFSNINNNVVGKKDLNTSPESLIENGEIALDFSCNTKKSIRENSVDNDEKDLTDAPENNEKTSDDKTSVDRSNPTENESKAGSNKRKRKSAVPRSISQVKDFYDEKDEKDELEEYEINNLNTDFPPEEESDHNLSGSGQESLSRSLYNDRNSLELNQSKSSTISTQSKESEKSRKESSDQLSIPLDLSLNRNKPSVVQNDKKEVMTEDEDFTDSDDDIEDEEDFFKPDKKFVQNKEKQNPSSSPSIPSLSSSTSSLNTSSLADPSLHLKDFAENTMNELISMYYGRPGAVDSGKYIPLKSLKHIPPYSQGSPSNVHSLGLAKSEGVAYSQNQPMSSEDDESHDNMTTPVKGIYANYVKSSGPSTSGRGGKLQNDRFTTSSSFINAVYSKTPGTPNVGGQISPALPNYSKYLKRYNSGIECGGSHCKELGYREHYHCIDCSFQQVFAKKEEMVRHYKWHRKREESLQHGFLRFSPMDNCSKKFGQCTHNSKQTHYHCLQAGCDKVYISTSDVQMHANYHRKDSAIMSEGFQRFRATEDCGTPSCSFYGQRTTHFHCLRPDCKFTFKNKADMEKHKSYHQKDEVLGRDGFKKFMKYEHCMYTSCRYSKLSNHIHCIRPGCDYVLHSTAQLYSHKRKHEKRDFESAYKKYRHHGSLGPQTPLSNLSMSDMGNSSASSVNSSPVTPAGFGGSSGMKRQLELDQSEPLELKRRRHESGSDVEMSAPSTPSGRSTPGDKIWQAKLPRSESMDGDDTSNNEDSRDYSFLERRHLANMEAENLSLSSSLNLPIPKLGDIKTGLTSLSSLPPTASVAVSQSATTSLHLGASVASPTPDQLFKPMTPEKATSSGMLSNPPGGGSLMAMNPGTLLTVPSTHAGASIALQPPKSVYTERREKDDSWKTYLVRYTANDPCNPRCQYLYKDHYHCKIEGCLVLFKSKDGVREHARFHELQDRITPIAYQTYESAVPCPEKCQYSEKEKHFHCIWTGCSHVIPYIGPTFGRLEHYRIHEYSRTSAGKSYNRGGSTKLGNIFDDNTIRRRGRPPKYPKIELPKIPKVELTDEEIQQSQITQSVESPGDMKVLNGFRVFSPEDPCPDDKCIFIGKLHYHCARPRCNTITDRVDVLNLHAKDFHSFVNILEGYEFFDRSVSCRRFHCPNNQTNRHFHCTRPKCDYSFIRHSTMSQHEKKHLGARSSSIEGIDSQRSPSRASVTQPSLVANHLQASLSSMKPLLSSLMPVAGLSGTSNRTTFISQSGNQIPRLTQESVILPTPQNLVAMAIASSSVAMETSLVKGTAPLSAVQSLPLTANQTFPGFPNSLFTLDGMSIDLNSIEAIRKNVLLNVLLKPGGMNQIPQPSWNELRAKMHYGLSQICGRPFCKLKKKDHYHCSECDQAFSDPARLRSHVGKHGIKLNRDITEHTPIAPKPANLSSQSQLAPMSKHSVPSNTVDMDSQEAKCLSDANMETKDTDDEDADDVKSSSLNLNPSMFSQMIFKAQGQSKMGSDDELNGEDDDYDETSLKIDTGSEIDDSQGETIEKENDKSSRSGRKITRTKHEDFINSDDLSLDKPRPQTASKNGQKTTPRPQHAATESNKVVPTGPRSMRDDSIPDGYSRWRYNEECKYPKCAYKHSVTHFHCIREDCGYGFSDRSRLIQHTLRHERIDSITGGELQQFRINQDCEIAECEHKLKMSHFHCKRCNYCCTDSSKVLTHRKQHAKADKIIGQGFDKCSQAEDCQVTGCPYLGKQSHFHCKLATCKLPVLGPTQMSAHRHRHTNDGDVDG